MDALTTAVADLRDAVEHDRGVNLDAAAARELLGLIGSAARDVTALAHVLGMLEDNVDEERELFRRTRERLHVRPGQTRAPVEWRRGRVGAAAELYGAAQAIVRRMQREEVTPTE